MQLKKRLKNESNDWLVGDGSSATMKAKALNLQHQKRQLAVLTVLR